MGTAPLLALAGCDRCLGEPEEAKAGKLYAVVDGVRLCREHWERAGCPFPKHIPTEVEIANAAAAVQRRMLGRGGTDRHLARSGKS